MSESSIFGEASEDAGACEANALSAAVSVRPPQHTNCLVMTKLTLSQLSSLLFRACDDLRGNMAEKRDSDLRKGG